LPEARANTVALTTTIGANAANCVVAPDAALRSSETGEKAKRIKSVFFPGAQNRALRGISTKGLNVTEDVA
jgi:hypothetical protein